MSDFLLNLARRSIGLASMIEVRHDPIDALPRAVETPPADATGRGAAPPPRDGIVEAAVPQIAAQPRAPSAAAERQTPTIAALPAPMVQRLTVPVNTMAPAVVIPASAPSPTGGNDAPVPRPLPAAVVEPERLAASRPAATAAGAESAPAARPIEYHVHSTIERTTAAPPAAEIAPRQPEPAVNRGDVEPTVHVIDDAPAVAPTIAPRLAVVPAAAVALPAPPRTEDATHRTDAAPPERTILVRIGAIEINGTEPPPQASASPPPPAATPPPGFDDFVHLRTYAPWAR